MSNKVRTVNWNKLINSNPFLVDRVSEFAEGKLSGRQFYESMTYTLMGGEVRNLLRTHGVDNARQLARKALRRRNLV